MSDLGVFGPDSATWKLHGEPILTVAGLRSLFLQALHPRAIAGVAQNSSYRTDPWNRLERTATYVVTVIYGTTEQAERAGRRVRAVHSRMRATDPFTGEEFRVDDPELLRWVHVTEVESFLTVGRRAGVGLTDAEADAYLHEQRRAAALVGLDPDDVPGSVAEVTAYYVRMQPELRLTKDAAEALMFLSVPPMPFGLGLTPVRAVYSGVAALAMGLLPAWARRRYGLPGIEATDPAATLTARGLRLAMKMLPSAVYEGPIYKDAMRRVAESRAAIAS